MKKENLSNFKKMYWDTKRKIANRKIIISVIGLGYVGFPLACLFSQKGFKVIGFDRDKDKIKKINSGKVDWSNWKSTYKNFIPTFDEKILDGSDIFIICVQTPLKKYRPDLTYIKDASSLVSRYLKRGNIVIIESTLYPGAVEEVVKPILESSGLQAGKDFFLGYSPERIDPGNKKWKIENIPKIVSGINKESKELVKKLYSTVIKKVVPVSNIKTAEAVKMVENVFRNVNISLIYELSLFFEKIGIDTWEVIKAASTKPFGFMPHYPGPGIGGHCIPKDPYYLLFKARKSGCKLKIVEEALKVSEKMPEHIIELVKKNVKKGSSIAVLGVTYKKNVPDIRRSPAEKIIRGLKKSGYNVFVFDPLVNETFGGKKCKKLKEAIKGKKCILLLVDHNYFKELEEKINKFSPSSVVVDTRNFINPNKLTKSIRYVGLGKGRP